MSQSLSGAMITWTSPAGTAFCPFNHWEDEEWPVCSDWSPWTGSWTTYFLSLLLRLAAAHRLLKVRLADISHQWLAGVFHISHTFLLFICVVILPFFNAPVVSLESCSQGPKHALHLILTHNFLFLLQYRLNLPKCADIQVLNLHTGH